MSKSINHVFAIRGSILDVIGFSQRPDSWTKSKYGWQFQPIPAISGMPDRGKNDTQASYGAAKLDIKGYIFEFDQLM
jgi:hypothetical protein